MIQAQRFPCKRSAYLQMPALRHCAYLNTYDSITRVTSRGSLATPLDAQSRLGAGEILQVANREMGW